MKISVVIPNYNGSTTLPLVLKGLQNQPQSADEIIIVDDGSTDNSLEILANYPEVKVISQSNSGAPVARNKGINAATGELVVLLDNDIIPSKDFLFEHLNWHKKYSDPKLAIVGLTLWDPSLELTPFMRWLGQGAQFDYQRLSGKTEVDFQAFYTSNLSIRRDFILENLFDESFKLAGATAFEDTELGFRLQKLGMKLVFNPQALAYHHEYKSFESMAKRNFNQGKISKLLYTKHPEIRAYFKENLKDLVSPLLCSPLGLPVVWLAKFLQNKVNVSPIFWLALLRYYEQGKHEAN